MAIERILNSTDAQDSNEIAMDIANYNRDEWNKSAENLCYEGIRQKFVQNPFLQEYLLETGNKTLVESSYDTVWDTGIPLGSADCLNPTKWKSIGILGNILMKIRNSIPESAAPPGQQNEPMSLDRDNRHHTPNIG